MNLDYLIITKKNYIAFSSFTLEQIFTPKELVTIDTGGDIIKNLDDQ